MTASADLWDWCDAVQRDPALRADARVVVLTARRRAASLRASGCGAACRSGSGRPALDAVAGIVAVEELELPASR